MGVFKKVLWIFGIIFILIALIYFYYALPVRFWWQVNDERVGSLKITLCSGLKINENVIFQKCHESNPIQLNKKL